MDGGCLDDGRESTVPMAASAVGSAMAGSPRSSRQDEDGSRGKSKRGAGNREFSGCCESVQMMATNSSDLDADEEKRALQSINVQLQTTIDRMRRELEESERRAEDLQQRVRVEAANDLVELKATIGALREQLEKQLHDAQALAQSLRVEYEAELAELRASIRTLRSELEAARSDGAAAVAKEQTAFLAERKALQDQIQAMRIRLEERA